MCWHQYIPAVLLIHLSLLVKFKAVMTNISEWLSSSQHLKLKLSNQRSQAPLECLAIYCNVVTAQVLRLCCVIVMSAGCLKCSLCHPLPMEDSPVLVFLSLSLMSWRSASRSLSSGFSSFDAADRTQWELCWDVYDDLDDDDETESLHRIQLRTNIIKANKRLC